MLNFEYGASIGSFVVDCGSDSPGVTGNHLFVEVGNQVTVCMDVLKHNTVARQKRTLRSVG
jgi:hypothetical protein